MANSAAIESGPSGAATASASANGGAGLLASVNGGDGGAATTNATAQATHGRSASASADATGGAAGSGGGTGGAGGEAIATAAGVSSRNSSADATATGGAGGMSGGFSLVSSGPGGQGGPAASTADSVASGGGQSTATATATGGQGGSSFGAKGGGGGDATATAVATGGRSATAMATAIGGTGGAGFSGAGANGAAKAQSTAQTNVRRVTLVQSTAIAQAGGTATTNAIAQGGGAGEPFSNPGQTAYSMATGLPGEAYLTTLAGGAGNVATALLGSRDVVFGSSIMGANYASNGGGSSLVYNATSTFDFAYRGDVLLGLIGDQSGFASGIGFQSLEFYVLDNGLKIYDQIFTGLTGLLRAETFFQNNVIDLGSFAGPTVDLTFGYNLTADGSGGFGFDFAVGDPPAATAVPEVSTWAMLLLGFGGLTCLAGFRGNRRKGAPAVS
jgi:hypothetical protein